MPLPTLLSQVLVAFTIEFDNEFEQRMPHATSASRAMGQLRLGPWLVSMAMWSNLMQFLVKDGMTVRELREAAGSERLPLGGMQRWGYITIENAEGRPCKAVGHVRLDWVVRRKPKGQLAQEIWRPLSGEVEQRWRVRFGAEKISELKRALAVLADQMRADVPEHMPILGYGMRSEELLEMGIREVLPRQQEQASERSLPALLSKVLLAFTIDFERGTGPATRLDPSLAICANVLRLFDPSSDAEGVRVRDLPRLSGVSKEAIDVAIGFLEKRGYVVIGPEGPGSRTKVARLTTNGVLVQEGYRRRLAEIEKQWRERSGARAVDDLRRALESVVIPEKPDEPSPLLRGIEPPPEGWRAAKPRPETLPHYPMVLHRGGYPDGS